MALEREYVRMRAYFEVGWYIQNTRPGRAGCLCEVVMLASIVEIHAII